MIKYLSEHVKDQLLSGLRRVRTITPWQAYKMPSGLYAPTDCAKETAQAVPSDWSGDFDFKSQALTCPCQSFVEDTKDATNTAMWGIRWSDRPGCWVNFKAIDGIGSRPEYYGNATIWRDLWPSCDLTIVQRDSNVQKILTLKDDKHQASFGFSVLMADGMTYFLDKDRIYFYDEHGIEVFRTKPVEAFDSSEDFRLDPSGRKYIKCSLAEGNPIGKFPTFWITPDAKDLEGAIYPIEIDPTTSLSGTTNTDDANINAPYPDGTPGAAETQAVQYGESGGNQRMLVMRISNIALIPDNLESFSVDLCVVENAGNAAYAKILKDSAAWVESPYASGTYAGYSSFNHLVHDTTHWAGGGAFSSSDYDADADPPTVDFDAQSYDHQDLDLPVEWAEAWRDETRVSNGFVLFSSATSNCTICTSDNSTEARRPIWKLEYTAGGYMPWLGSRR